MRNNYPWFTDNLKFLKQIKQKAWNRYKKTLKLEHKNYYCQLRNYYNSAIILEKRAYYRHSLASCGRNSTLFWKKIKSWSNMTYHNDLPNVHPFNDVGLINQYFIGSIPQSNPDVEYLSEFSFNVMITIQNFLIIP